MSSTTPPRAQAAIYSRSIDKRNIGRRPFRQPPSGHIRWPTSARKLKSDLLPNALCSINFLPSNYHLPQYANVG